MKDEFKNTIEQLSVKAEAMGIRKFERDEAGQMNFTPSNIIGLVISMLVLAIIAPIAIDELSQVNTTDWPSTVTTVWEMLPIFAVIGFLLMILAPTLKDRFMK